MPPAMPPKRSDGNRLRQIAADAEAIVIIHLATAPEYSRIAVNVYAPCRSSTAWQTCLRDLRANPAGVGWCVPARDTAGAERLPGVWQNRVETESWQAAYRRQRDAGSQRREDRRGVTAALYSRTAGETARIPGVSCGRHPPAMGRRSVPRQPAPPGSGR